MWQRLRLRTHQAVQTPVNVAKLSRAVSVVAQVLLGSNDIRTEKVAALQQSIVTGAYKVSSSAVAVKLMGTVEAAVNREGHPLSRLAVGLVWSEMAASKTTSKSRKVPYRTPPGH